MVRYAVRIHLPDRPGALGAVASRIGAVGGDIIAIDILDRADGQAMDEFIIELAGEELVDCSARRSSRSTGEHRHGASRRPSVELTAC